MLVYPGFECYGQAECHSEFPIVDFFVFRSHSSSIGHDFAKRNFRHMVTFNDQQHSEWKLHVYTDSRAVCIESNDKCSGRSAHRSELSVGIIGLHRNHSACLGYDFAKWNFRNVVAIGNKHVDRRRTNLYIYCSCK